MTVLAQILDVNDSQSGGPSGGLHAWWADLAAANDDGTCAAPGPGEAAAAGAGAGAAPCDAGDGPCAPAPPWAMRDARLHPARASANGCPAYAGDLWADVLEYRGTRARALGGSTPTDDQRRRFAEIEARLRGAADDMRRQFLRFGCRFRATIELADARIPATVLDASAGGVKVECASVVHEGDPVVLELEAESLAGRFALPARVIWVRDGFVGLMFAGAPQWR